MYTYVNSKNWPGTRDFEIPPQKKGRKEKKNLFTKLDTGRPEIGAYFNHFLGFVIHQMRFNFDYSRNELKVALFQETGSIHFQLSLSPPCESLPTYYNRPPPFL